MLQNYIIEVLFKDQVCCVPGVGTFTIQHIPAHFNVVEQQLVPPRQQILFEERWDDEYACATWVSQKENLVESVARLKTNVYVEQFKQQLDEGKTITLPGIGSLHKDPYSHLVFTPQELPDTWSPLNLQPVLRPESAPRVTVGNTEVVNQQVVDHTFAMPDEGRNFKWWWVVFPLLLIGLGAAGWYFWQQQQQAAKPETAVTPVLPVTQDSSSTQPAKSDSLATAPVVTSDSVQYYAVYMTYKLLTNAEGMVKKQRSWQKNPEIVIYPKDSLYYLAIPFKALPADTTAILDSLRKKLTVPVFLDVK